MQNSEQNAEQQPSAGIAQSNMLGEGGSEKGKIEFKIQKKRPKKNAKSYNIETVQDIFDAVNSKNIKKFLREFEMVLRSGLLLKAIHEANIAEGKYSAEEAGKLELPRFTWIDD
jgi:hypothetical protein